MRIAGVLRHDLRLQYRHGFHAAYLVVVAVYLCLLGLLPAPIGARLLAPALLSEVSVIGFFFAGTLVMLERGDGTLHALAVTPLHPREYLLSKVFSLGALAAVATLVLGAGMAASWLFPMVIGALLTAAFFVSLGITMACRFATIERFLVWGGLVNAAFGLPVLPYFGVLESPLWWALPTTASLAMLAGTRPPATAVGWILLCSLGASVLACRSLSRHTRGGAP